MPIIHIILFEFNPTVTPAQVEDVCKRMLALKDTCIHPTTQKPYVKSYGGGKDNSPEGHQVSRSPSPPHPFPFSPTGGRVAQILMTFSPLLLWFI